MTNKNKITSLLYLHCQGRDNSIKSGEITAMTMIPDREIREIIRELRKEGHPIGSGEKGYWWIVDSGELKKTMANLKSRAFDLLRTVRIQEGIPAAELLGQLKLHLEATP